MKKPLNIAEAARRRLLATAKTGIHTFSNGTDWEWWAEHNCLECWFWDPDTAGADCAFEAAAMMSMVSPELAEMFGWIQDPKYRDYEPPYRQHGWEKPRQCPLFHQRPDRGDDGEYPPPPPDPDPHQLVLIADPTEDLSLARPPRERVLSAV